MAWTAPMTFVDGSALTAPQMNTHLRDNLSEQAASKASTPGAYFTVVAPNFITERSWAVASVPNQIVNFEETSYDDLDGSYGPEVTLQTGTSALVFISTSARCENSKAFISFAVSGESSIDPADENAIAVQQQGSTNADAAWMMSSTIVPLRNLEPGTNTFTMKYRVQEEGVADFQFREITVIPF